MLNIIEGANFVGKTSTLDVLRNKSKSSIFVYHPRFNDSKTYRFNYRMKQSMSNEVKEYFHDVHRDVVYQISHTVCLKYLNSFKEKNIIMDRIFLSEMVYNDYIDIKFYEQLVEILKRDFKYKIYFLTCDNDEELKKRITARLEADKEKGYGVRVGDINDPDTVEEKFQTQKMLTDRYISIFDGHQLDYVKIDTSNIPQKQVAEHIMLRMKEKNNA